MKDFGNHHESDEISDNGGNEITKDFNYHDERKSKNEHRVDKNERRQYTIMSIVYDVFQEIFLSGSMNNTQQCILTYSYGSKSKDLHFLAKWFFRILLWIDVVLRGIAQVFLSNHPISGICICIGLGWTSWEMLGYSILTTGLATLSAYVVATASPEDILAGLCGYDGALVGCACYNFLDPSYNLSAAILLSCLSGVVHVACFNILKAWNLPTFTFAFNIVTVMILLGIENKVVSLNYHPPVVTNHPENWTEMSVMFVVDASIRGVGQFMFADTTVGSAWVIGGIAIASRQGAFKATLGATVGWLMSLYVLKVSNVVAIRSGLYGYNCAGTCAALAGGVFFNKYNLKTALVGVVGACLCSLLTVGIVGALKPVPCLTFPFITTTWLMLVTRTNWLSNKHMASSERQGRDAILTECENEETKETPDEKADNTKSKSNVFYRFLRRKQSSKRLKASLSQNVMSSSEC